MAACSWAGVAVATAAGFDLATFVAAVFLGETFFAAGRRAGFRTAAFFALALAVGGFRSSASSRCLRKASQRFFWAATMRFRAAPLSWRFLGVASAAAAGLLPEVPIRRRISATFASIWSRWCSNPISAA